MSPQAKDRCLKGEEKSPGRAEGGYTGIHWAPAHGKVGQGSPPVTEDPQPSYLSPACPIPSCEQPFISTDVWPSRLWGAVSSSALMPSPWACGSMLPGSSSLVLGCPEHSGQRGKWRWDFNSQTHVGDTHSRSFFDPPFSGSQICALGTHP